MSSMQLDRQRPKPDRVRRPFGLYMILILLTVQALLGVLLTAIFGIGAFVDAAEFWSLFTSDMLDVIVPIAVLLITLVVAIGLWRYRSWGWYGMMLLLAYHMATDAYAYFTGKQEPLLMLLNVVMVFYLNQREVRVLFEEPAAGKGIP
jgi:CDP-diglyceride synthetase